MRRLLFSQLDREFQLNGAEQVAGQFPTIGIQLSNVLHRSSVGKPQRSPSGQCDIGIYAYAVLESELRIKAIAEGYDPTIGVMHEGSKRVVEIHI